jgi:glycosyltransferase involved in cell wall biosynthesis
MKILVLSWRDPKHPLSGGAEQVMHMHMRAWIKSGHEVTLFSSSFPGCKKEEVIDSINIVRKGNQLLGVQIASFYWYFFGKHPKFDFVVDQFHGIPFFTPLYIKTPKLAVVQEVAREVWFMNELRWPINLMVGPLGYYLEPIVYKLYKNLNFMTGSLSAKKDLLLMGIKEDKIHIIHHGILLPIRKQHFKKEKVTTIIFLGAITKDKGVNDAVEAFSIINKLGKFKFWIVGRGPLNIASDLPPNTKFWGYVDEAKKFELLSRAHVLVNPSKREGWGLVNVEANAMGTPVVAYSAPGLVDSVSQGVSGLIVRKNTPQELANQIVKLVSDNKKYNLLCRSSVKWSKKFDWGVSTEKSLKLISAIAKQTKNV